MERDSTIVEVQLVFREIGRGHRVKIDQLGQSRYTVALQIWIRGVHLHFALCSKRLQNQFFDVRFSVPTHTFIAGVGSIGFSITCGR